jgi:hypothetical protein
MNTIAISLIEKKPHHDGGTFDHVKNVEVQKLQTKANYIPLKDVISQKETPTLLEIQNQNLTTLLDCTGFTPYELWYFDENFQFTGKAYSLNEGPGTFQIQTQAKWIVLIHLLSTEFDKLKTFQCSDLDIANKYKFVEKAFPKYYGVFPYFIIKRENSPCFTQIPIHINPSEENLPGWTIDEVEQYKLESDDLLEQLLISEGKDFYIQYCNKEGKTLKMALVTSPTKAFYFEENMEPKFSNQIPFGGVLLGVEEQIIATHTMHYLNN